MPLPIKQKMLSLNLRKSMTPKFWYLIVDYIFFSIFLVLFFLIFSFFMSYSWIHFRLSYNFLCFVLDIYIYIYIYIYLYIYIYIFINLVIFILFLLSSAVIFFLHCMLTMRYEKYFVKLMSRFLHSRIHQVMWYSGCS